MKKTCYLILVLLLTSCVSLQPGVFQPIQNHCIKLPNLDPVFDFVSFESFYGGYTWIEHTDEDGAIISTTNRQQGLQDALTLFERNVRNCITDEFTENKGYIICKLAAAGISNNSFFSIASGLSLGLINLFGFPFSGTKVFIDIEVAIYNNDNKLIARYYGDGKLKNFSGLYYGYRLHEVSRATKLEAFSLALEEVKAKIANDKEKIISML